MNKSRKTEGDVNGEFLLKLYNQPDEQTNSFITIDDTISTYQDYDIFPFQRNKRMHKREIFALTEKPVIFKANIRHILFSFAKLSDNNAKAILNIKNKI